MPNTRSLLIIVILIISISFISVSVSGPTTGKLIAWPGNTWIVGNEQGKQYPTTLSISPKIFQPGETIHITIHPGSLGAYREIKFCQSAGGLCQQQTRWCFSSFQCNDPATLDYPLPTSFKPGVWSMEVYDYYSNDYVTTQFEVQSPPPEPIVSPVPTPASLLNSFINNH